MSRRTDERLRERLDEAQTRGSCLASGTRMERDALWRRVRSGELVSPHPGMYVRGEHWRELSVAEQELHVVRCLSRRRPTWTFCHTTAALVRGLSVSHALLGTIHASTSSGAHGRRAGNVVHHIIEGDRPEVISGVPVTSAIRTVVDCLRTVSFRDGLAIVDSALRLGQVTRKGLESYLFCRRCGMTGIIKARGTFSHADGRAESGGESIARAVMIEQGFPLPDLQVPVYDRIEGRMAHRVDFLWTLPDVRHVAGEFDGNEKLTNPEMTKGRSAVELLRDERNRESRITLEGLSVLRFTYSDVMNVPRFCRMLEAAGIKCETPPIDMDEWRDFGARKRSRRAR